MSQAERLQNRYRLVEACLMLFALALFLLHFVHLRADFPNRSPWMDWAKYTDEGWYGDAAIRYYLRGAWHLPGDFNPGAALPVWPLLEALVFRFTGVGIVAARTLAVCVFGGILVCGYVLLRSPLAGQREGTGRIFAAAALALLTASSFLYAFTRMAILEPLLILWLLLALLLARSLRASQAGLARMGRLVGVGLIAALMVGTKTTAMFLLPSICWMLGSASGWQPRKVLRDTAVAAAAGVLPGLLYFFLLVRGGFLQDVRYLFTANAYTAITRDTFWAVVWQTLQDGMWIGPLLYPLALVAIVVAAFRPRAWQDPVFASLVLWTAGYLSYIAFHANFQPRYYLVVAIPMLLLLVRASMHLRLWNPRVFSATASLLLLGLLAFETRSTLAYVLHPEYSFQTAAERIGRIVEQEPAHSHTVLSISGSNLSLMTGVPSICDDFGTMDLEDRIAVYKPGWFVTWNFVEDDKMEALTRFYRLTRVASFPAMDDPERNLMIVYRLDGKQGPEPRRRKPVTRSSAQEVQQTRTDQT